MEECEECRRFEQLIAAAEAEASKPFSFGSRVVKQLRADYQVHLMAAHNMQQEVIHEDPFPPFL